MPAWLLLLVSLGVSSAAAQEITQAQQTPGAVLKTITCQSVSSKARTREVMGRDVKAGVKLQ